jgi:hypothetical protein
MAERQAGQRRRPGRSNRYMSQPNNAIETGSATNTTRGATASTLTTSGSWIDLLAASVPIPVPAWPGPAVVGVRAGRASTSPPLRGCRLGTLRPAGPADLLAGRRIAARPRQGQGRSVPPCGPVLPPLCGALRAPLTPPRPARSPHQAFAPGGRGAAAPPAAKAGETHAPLASHQQPNTTTWGAVSPSSPKEGPSCPRPSA